jgi:hypothetical protein
MNAPVFAPGFRWPPLLKYLDGVALLALGRPAEAVQPLEESRDVASSVGARTLSWQIRAALARAYHESSRPDAAEREQAASRALVSELGGALPAGELRRHFLDHALRRVAEGF